MLFRINAGPAQRFLVQTDPQFVGKPNDLDESDETIDGDEVNVSLNRISSKGEVKEKY